MQYGNDVYLFGGYYSKTTAYKYNTLTDKYTKLANIPYNFSGGDATVNGTNVYLFGGTENNTYAYKYNTLTNTYTQLANIPYNFSFGSAINVGINIYLYGGEANKTTAYKYNTLTDIYTKLTDIPYQFSNGSAVATETSIYLFGSNHTGYGNNAYKYNITDFQNKEIVVQNKELFKTKLTKQLQTYFNNAFIYDDNELKPYPCYYGDGTKWNLIEKAS